MFVKDEMTVHPITISPDRPIIEAQRIMHDNGIRHLPVVTAKGSLVGLVTRTSLDSTLPSKLTTLSIWEMNYQVSRIKVSEAMIKDVVTISEDTPIEEAANLMLQRKVGSLVVMRGDRLAGIITDTDLMRIMTELLGVPEPGVRLTLLVPDEEGQLCRVTSIIADNNGYINAFGTYPADQPLKWWVIVKVRFVDKDALVQAFKQVPEIELIDVREN